MTVLGFILIGLGAFVQGYSLWRLFRDVERAGNFISTWELVKRRGLWRPERLLSIALLTSGIILLFIAHFS
jgi:hypothetical protein